MLKRTISDLRRMTHMYTEEMRKIGIPVQDVCAVELNGGTRALGVCNMCRKNLTGEIVYKIGFSKGLLDCKFETVAQVVIHELIHTCKGCMNHGVRFKAYALIASKHFRIPVWTTANAKQSADFASSEFVKSKMKYAVMIMNGASKGKLIESQRITNIVKSLINHTGEIWKQRGGVRVYFKLVKYNGKDVSDKDIFSKGIPARYMAE